MEWHSMVEGSGREGTFDSPTYAFVRSLPADPDKLAGRIRARSKELREQDSRELYVFEGAQQCQQHPDDPDCKGNASPGESGAHSMWSPTGLAIWTLRGSVVPSDTAAALFKAMQQFDGVKVQKDVTLAASGETGVAIVTPSPMSLRKEERIQLVFDPRSYELLGTQSVAATGKSGKAGTKLLSSTAIVERAIVSKKGQLP